MSFTWFTEKQWREMEEAYERARVDVGMAAILLQQAKVNRLRPATNKLRPAKRAERNAMKEGR